MRAWAESTLAVNKPAASSLAAVYSRLDYEKVRHAQHCVP